MKAIYLTGFMGTGKSTIGELLAEKLGLDVIDTDNWIMDNTGKSITNIFAEEGEEVFRNYESNALQVIPTSDVIISTGGGIVIREENRQYMRENGLIINLTCDFPTIVERVQLSSQTKNTRPLFQQDISEFEQRFIARQPLYLDADVVIDTNKPMEEVIIEIEEWISANR